MKLKTISMLVFFAATVTGACKKEKLNKYPPETPKISDTPASEVKSVIHPIPNDAQLRTDTVEYWLTKHSPNDTSGWGCDSVVFKSVDTSGQKNYSYLLTAKPRKKNPVTPAPGQLPPKPYLWFFYAHPSSFNGNLTRIDNTTMMLDKVNCHASIVQQQNKTTSTMHCMLNNSSIIIHADRRHIDEISQSMSAAQWAFNMANGNDFNFDNPGKGSVDLKIWEIR